MVNFVGTETAPSSGVSSPTTIRKSVVLPAPLGPTSPTFSPGFNWNEASTKSNCLPYCLLMFEKEIILKEQLAARYLFQFSPAREFPANADQREPTFNGTVGVTNCTILCYSPSTPDCGPTKL